jgi:hypothetical protein
MHSLRGILLAVALASVAAPTAPAGAALISSGDGTGNTTAPPGSPAFLYTGAINGLSGIYLGNAWVLTANHVGTGALTLNGVTHGAVPGTAVRLDHAPGVPTDLRLFRIATDPGLTPLAISATTPALGTPLVLAGNGRNRGAPASWEGEAGWSWGPGYARRWGTNHVDASGLDLTVGDSRVRSLVLQLDPGLPTAHEAIAAVGDSGGSAFSGTTLAGVLYAISTYQGQPPQTALFGNATLAVDLAYYRSAIVSVAAGRACSDGADDDGDGRVDLQDPGCNSGGDAFETNALMPCDDGFDSDGDGLVDWPDDPGCADLTWLYENPACDDGIDNDGDGKIDWDGGPGGGVKDPQCTQGFRRNEAPQSCGLGFEIALLAPLLFRLRRLRGAR